METPAGLRLGSAPGQLCGAPPCLPVLQQASTSLLFLQAEGKWCHLLFCETQQGS